MAKAHARPMPREPRRLHLPLVDNVNGGEPIVAEAKKRNTAKVVAAELGIDIEPVALPRRRTAKKRTPNRNGPVETTVLWVAVSPHVKALALEKAGGDKRRCKVIDHDTIVVLNNPGKEPR